MGADNAAAAIAAEWLALVRALESRGEFLQAYDAAQQGLAAHPQDLWLKHRAVLVLAKAGATRRAGEELRRLGLIGHSEVDVAALEARLAKDTALAAPPKARGELLRHAGDLYERVYRRGGGYYPGINVATLRLLAGDLRQAVQVANEVLALCSAAPGDDFFRAATQAEALLVLGQAAEACAALVTAAALTDDLAAKATTRRQLRLVIAARGIDEAVLAPLIPPTVINYTGHMIAAPGVAGRFLASSEPQVAADIAAVLERHGVGFGYGPLASGSDILFAETLLARKAELHVVLPFDREEFKAISVAPAEAGWLERFDACLSRAQSVTYATDDRYLGHDQLFTYGSYMAMGLAVLRARYIDAPVRQIAVWDGAPAAGVTGTAIDVAIWQAHGGAVDVIACGPATGAAAKPSHAASGDAPAGTRELRAMLFGDVAGFSKLHEAQIPPFVEHVLGAFGRTLARYEGAVLYANTWGDGLFVVLKDTEAAAECALDLQRAMAEIPLAALGLPETLALRLGGHFGPVFEAEDPVQHVTNFFGAHVSRTARIEPVTPPAEVYITEPFAARLALGPGNFASDYVGQVPAAKGYGTLRMYHLRRG